MGRRATDDPVDNDPIGRDRKVARCPEHGAYSVAVLECPVCLSRKRFPGDEETMRKRLERQQANAKRAREHNQRMREGK